MDLHDRHVLVVGFGITGIPLVRFLHRKNARITLTDIKTDQLLAQAFQSVTDIPLRKILGGHPDDLSVYGAPDLIILSPGVPLDLPFLMDFRQKGIPMIGEVELAYQFMKAPVTAITGTNGKTTTTALAGEIFKLGGCRTEVVGNIGIPAITKAEELEADHFFVMEVSSFQLETIQTFRPKAAALLNITPDHLNRHGSLDAYADLKYRIFENQQEEDVAVLNADDPVTMAHPKPAKPMKLYFSRKQKPKEGIFCEGNKMISRWKDEEKFIIDIDRIKIPGSHNLENAMAATGLALSAGVSPDAIQQGLMTFKGVEHRIEHVKTVNQVNYVNDSKATNPDAAIKAIEAVEAPIILLAGGMDKKNDFTQFFQSLQYKVKKMIVYGETAEILMDTAFKTGFREILRVSDLEEAVARAAEIALPHDTVLLSPACASWDMYSSYEERGDHFKALVEKIS